MTTTDLSRWIKKLFVVKNIIIEKRAVRDCPFGILDNNFLFYLHIKPRSIKYWATRFK